MSGIIQTWDEATTELVDRFGGRDDIDDRVNDWLNEAQIWIAKCDVDLPQLEAVGVTKVILANTSEVSVTNDLGLLDVIGIRLARNETNKWLMQHFPFKEYRRISTQAQGPPVRWTRHGDVFVVDGVPTLDTTIKFDYRRRPLPDELDVSDEWIEYLLRLTMHIGWNALQEPDLAINAYKMLPMWLQPKLQTPLTEDEWEAMWDEDLGIEPYTVGYYG